MKQVLEEMMTEHLSKFDKIRFFQTWNEDRVKRFVIGDQYALSALGAQQISMLASQDTPERFDVGDWILFQFLE